MSILDLLGLARRRAADSTSADTDTVRRIVASLERLNVLQKPPDDCWRQPAETRVTHPRRVALVPSLRHAAC